MPISVATHRRTLHTIPEIHVTLPKTIGYLKEVLTPLGCTFSAPTQGSLCAFFDAGKDQSIAFRADMDALPIQEVSVSAYSSTHTGAMHACGHDGHMAIALGVADYVATHLQDLPHNVLLVFQPAEETTGGAQPICQSGIFEQYHVKRLFGLHMWPNVPAGHIVSTAGAMMAQSNEVTIEIEGKSVHLSRSEQGLDALVAGMNFLEKAYAMVERLDSCVPRKLRFGRMESGTVRNAVSGHTRLEGSLRTYDADTFAFCSNGLRAIGEEITQATGCHVTVTIPGGYPPVWNAQSLYQEMVDYLDADAPLPLEKPALASEDFSFYQQHLPALFFFLGTGQTPELHANDFDFDDAAILPKGVAFFTILLYWY